ncbi:hypothetical protein FOZ63_004568, partial [Perkinsus olseni]
KAGLRGSGGGVNSIHLLVVVVGVEGKGYIEMRKGGHFGAVYRGCYFTTLRLGYVSRMVAIYYRNAVLHDGVVEWLDSRRGDESRASTMVRPGIAAAAGTHTDRLIPTLFAIIPSPALFPSYQPPVVGDRLVALEGQVRNLQVQVNSLCISQPATETVPDASPQDERVLSEIQQLRSTVALLCDELKK